MEVWISMATKRGKESSFGVRSAAARVKTFFFCVFRPVGAKNTPLKTQAATWVILLSQEAK
jgi:hypothetical protein